MGRNIPFSRLLLTVAVPMAWLLPVSAQTEAGYLGNEVCAECHDDRAGQHSGSNFDGSWKPVSWLDGREFEKVIQEGEITYRVVRTEDGWVFRIERPGSPPEVFPIHSIIGGQRHGHSMMLAVSHVAGFELPRETIVEARYLIDAKTSKLRLSPGFPPEKPTSYETLVGRVLSPSFTNRCFECHGGILDEKVASQGGPHPEFVSTGVACERCHGPGAPHLAALDGEGEGLGIINPANLPNRQSVDHCAQCHNGFEPPTSPRPYDILISNQATAIRNSQCFIASDAGFACVSCHDPHGNAPKQDPAYENTCRSCHDGVKVRVRCSVNTESGCIGCHMPQVKTAAGFDLTDHWIRVVR